MKFKFESAELTDICHQIINTCNTLIDHKDETIQGLVGELKKLQFAADRLVALLAKAEQEQFAEAYAEQQVAEATGHTINLQKESEAAKRIAAAKEQEAEDFGERFVNSILRDPRRFS